MTRQVRSWAIAALAAFALAGAAAPSFAGIIYNITNATSVQNGYSLSGSIEVSGTGNDASLSSFNLTATKADNPTLTFSSVLGDNWGSGNLIATDSALYVPAAGTLQIFKADLSQSLNWLNDYFGSTFYSAALNAPPATVFWNSGSYPITDGNSWQIGSVQAVPEPSTYCMALAGLACGGYSMFRRRKQA
jgi:hypothetical protein